MRSPDACGIIRCGSAVCINIVDDGGKKFQEFFHRGMSTVIGCGEKYGIRSRGYNATLVYLLNGNTPRIQGICCQAP